MSRHRLTLEPRCVHHGFALAILILFGALCCSARDFPRLIAWYVQSNNMDEPLRNAGEYPVNALFVQVYPDWNKVAEDMSFHDAYPKLAKAGAARARAERVRAELGVAVRKTVEAKLDFYLMLGEFDYPDNLFQQYPEMRDPDKDAFWNFIASRVDEVLAALPDVAGLIVYLDEAPHKIYELQGNRPAEDYIGRLLSIYLQACSARHKHFIISSFTNYYPERLETLARAIRRFAPSPNFAVMNWICPSDWGLFRVLNPAIGHVGGHPEILNFDFSGENWGEGNVPLGQLDYVAERLHASLGRGANIAGLSAWVNWWIPQNVFGTPSEVNLYGLPLLLESPGTDPARLYEAWLERRYGKEAAPILLPAFRQSFDVVTGSRQVLGFWAMEYPKSEFAAVEWIDFSLRADSPAVWDNSFRSVEADLLNPDERVLEEVLREKGRAAATAQAALEAVEAARRFISVTDYQPLLRSFTRARDEARVPRPYFELFFRYKMWARDHQASRLDRIRELQGQLRNWADYFDRNYPNDPLHNARRIREYVGEIDGLLSGKPLPQVVVTW